MTAELIPTPPLAPSLGWRTVTVQVATMTGGRIGTARGVRTPYVTFALTGDVPAPTDDVIVSRVTPMTVHLDAEGKGEIQLPVWAGGDWAIRVRPSWSEPYLIRVPAGSGSIDLADIPAVVLPKAGALREL